MTTEPEDSLRSDYKRSDFGELVRGKHATTQVGFQQLAEALLVCIVEDEGPEFEHHAIGNYLAKHTEGDWTYEIDNANQITLRYWLSEFGNIEEEISGPAVVMNAIERKELFDALHQGVANLRAKARMPKQ